MKKTYFIFAVLFLMSLFSFSQQPNKEVIFDFNNPMHPAVIEISPRQSILVKLQNVNPYLYDVAISDTVINHVARMPDQWGEIFAMPGLPKDLPDVVPPANGKGASKAVSAGNRDTLAISEELIEILKEFKVAKESVAQTLDYSGLINELTTLLYNCGDSLPVLIQTANNLVTGRFSSLTNAQIPAGINGEVQKQQKSSRDKLNALQEKIKDLMAVQGQQLKKHTGSMADYRKLEASIAEENKILADINTNLGTLDKSLTAFEAAKVGEKITDIYMKVKGSRITIYKLTRTRFNTDEVQVKIGVKKVGEWNCPNLISDFNIEAVTKGGVKVDFSSGIVFNIGNKNFFDQQYRIDSFYRNESISTDSVQIVRNNNRNMVIPSIGVFMHIYSRGWSSLQLGGMFGASLGSDQRVYYHLGPSVLIGKNEKIFISAGISAAKANVLNGAYREDEPIKRASAPTTVPVESAMRLGGFVSVTWNMNLIK